MCAPYLELSQLPAGDPDSEGMAEALLNLGLAKRINDAGLLKGVDLTKVVSDISALDGIKNLPEKEQNRIVIDVLSASRDIEPTTVTTRMLPLRLLHQVQEGSDLETEAVDAIIEVGQPMAPLLIGLLRDWVQNLLDGESDVPAENALALLGEIGSASEISPLLEFVDLANETGAGASAWAVGRILERHPEQAVQFIRSMELKPAERLSLAAQILNHPKVDPEGTFFQYLGDNLQSMKQKDRDAFYPAYLLTLAAAKGHEVIGFGRKSSHAQRYASFPGHAARLPGNACRFCEEWGFTSSSSRATLHCVRNLCRRSRLEYRGAGR
jgi:hypothetical protein